MERGPTSDEAAKTTGDAIPAFLTGHDAARADFLMLLRAVFADGPLGVEARAALRRAAFFLGVGKDEIELVIEPLESAGASSALIFAAMGRESRVQLMRRAMEVAAHDPDLMARSARLQARLMALLDLSPEDVPNRTAV